MAGDFSVDALRGNKLHEGKAKILYETPDEDRLLMEFKDDATAFDGKKKGTIKGKGYFNAQISAAAFRYLESRGVQTHFIDEVDERHLLVRRGEIIPVEVVIRNRVAGSLAKRLGLPEGEKLSRPILEFFYKNDDLGDPMVNRYHILAMDLCAQEDIVRMEEDAWRINSVLKDLMSEHGMELVDFKLEFARAAGEILLADEISPDTCRLWDLSSGDRLDKDRFRRDMGGVEEAYSEVHRRLVGEG